MNRIILGPAPRGVLALGLAGAWLFLSAVASGSGPAAPFAAVDAAAEPNGIRLAQVDTGPTETKVSFTMDQADRGESRYERDCMECHGDDLKGGLNGGAPLRGRSFEQKYFEGAPASWLFEYMSSAMPPNSPGRYPANTYANLMAYVLKRNGFQPGAPLPSDLDALDEMIIEK